MKKSLLLVAFMAIVGVATAVAQPRAIGGQLGYGIEFSYEHSLGDNFLSVDLGFPGLFMNHTFGIETAATYNWLNPFGADFPTISKGDWNWYMGAGLGIGNMYQRYNKVEINGHKAWDYYNHFYVGAAGRVGVEYNFWFPLQLSVEWRPIIGPSFSTHAAADNNGNKVKDDTVVGFYTPGLWIGGLSLGVRYQF